MDYEKKYKNALERARDVYTYYCDDREQLRKIESIFPELKESEDERIRKSIIELLNEVHFTFKYYDINKMLAWLEKQGEHQNFREKIQVGDQVTRNEDGVLVNLSQLKRVAKQGEQKPAECGQETKPNGGIVSEDFNEGDGYYKVNLAYLSKSQVELIENLVDSWQNSANNIAAWSEEDEKMLGKCIDAASGYYSPEDKQSMKDWLKSLKDRVLPQPKQEWSEEDIERMVAKRAQASGTLKNEIDFYRQGIEDTLKSLRPQSGWKPSDEQMNTLEYYMHTLICNEHKEILFGLYSDLKILMEE